MELMVGDLILSVKTDDLKKNLLLWFAGQWYENFPLTMLFLFFPFMFNYSQGCHKGTAKKNAMNKTFDK